VSLQFAWNKEKRTLRGKQLGVESYTCICLNALSLKISWMGGIFFKVSLSQCSTIWTHTQCPSRPR
jgi:hypothetical protein